MPSIPHSVKPTRTGMDPVTGALIGTGINAISQIGQNRKNRKFAVDRYNVERQDNLADWERQNIYNSPVEARKRLEEAGMSPFTAMGASVGGGNAQQVRGSQTNNPETEAAKLDLGEYFTAKKLGLETKINKASTRKLNADAEAVEIENKNRKQARDQEYYDDRTGTWRGPEGRKGLATLTNLRESALRQTKTKAEMVKIEKSIELMQSQMDNLDAQNLPYKVALEILETIKTITNWDVAKKVAVNKIKQAQTQEKQ